MDSTTHPSKDNSTISENVETIPDYVNLSSIEQSQQQKPPPNPAQVKHEQGVLRRIHDRRATNPNGVRDLFSVTNNDSIISQ